MDNYPGLWFLFCDQQQSAASKYSRIALRARAAEGRVITYQSAGVDGSRKKTSCDYAAMAMDLLILSILACENQIVQLVPARRSRLQSSLAQDQAFDPEPAKDRSDQHSSVCMNLTFKCVHTKKSKMTMKNM